MGRWFFVIFFLLSGKAMAYPEYAVRYNMISCTACHVSPIGGGPRNVNGKLFGAHGYKINPILVQDYISADFRVLDYYPQRPGPSKSGVGIMQGSVAGHVALDEKKSVELVLEHNFAGFAQAQYRDSYALIRLSEKLESWTDTLLVGRFRAPFGIITDEHRTYVRIQSATEYYTFESGLMLSGNPSSQWHYDVAMVGGEKSTGQSLQQGQAERWGSILNVRYMPGPILFGVSGSYHNHDPESDSRKAMSLYSIFSIDRWTNGRIPVFVQIEHTRAKNWNSNLGRGFANDSNYVTSISSSASQGWYVQAEWALTNRFNIIYKYDLLQPDQDYPADIYDRHGLGIRWVFAPNAILQVRTEIARATQPSEEKSSAEGGQDATFAILQLAL